MPTDLLQHYGVDWIAMALTFFAIYALGNKKRYGFCVMMAGNACWIALALKFQSLGMIAANLGFLAMNLRGFVRWDEMHTFEHTAIARETSIALVKEESSYD